MPIASWPMTMTATLVPSWRARSARLLPTLPPDASEKMRSLTIETIEKLAHRVRRILAEEIKALDCVPKRIIDRLAHDIDEAAAAILEYSPLLSDADLVEIISSAQARFALTAIARRKPLSANVSEAIAMALDIPAVSALLVNLSAQIRNRRSTRSSSMVRASRNGTYRWFCVTICRSAPSAASPVSSAPRCSKSLPRAAD